MEYMILERLRICLVPGAAYAYVQSQGAGLNTLRCFLEQEGLLGDMALYRRMCQDDCALQVGERIIAQSDGVTVLLSSAYEADADYPTIELAASNFLQVVELWQEIKRVNAQGVRMSYVEGVVVVEILPVERERSCKVLHLSHMS